MKLTKQRLRQIIKEELADAVDPKPDLHADVTKLVKEVSYLASDIDDMDLENPGALIQRIQRLDAIALAVANKHDIDLYG